MNPSIEEAKNDLAILEKEIELLRLIAYSARELATHDDMEATWYCKVADKASMHWRDATRLQAHIKAKYSL